VDVRVVSRAPCLPSYTHGFPRDLPFSNLPTSQDIYTLFYTSDPGSISSKHVSQVTKTGALRGNSDRHDMGDGAIMQTKQQVSYHVKGRGPHEKKPPSEWEWV